MPWMLRQISRSSLSISSARKMSSSSEQKAITDTALSGSDSWFNKYKPVSDTPENLFQGVLDRFNGITVDSNMEKNKGDEDFQTTLQASLEHWIDSKRRGIWFKVHLDAADWIPVLAKNNFSFHHAKDDFAMMYRWLPEVESANIPKYAHTMVGVGAVVLNSKNQVLVVSEKHAHIKDSWKLPGGFVDRNEDLTDAAIREVLEETGIQTTFESMIAVNHAHNITGFSCSDLYFVMGLKPANEEIVKCEREIAKCQWMEVEEYLKHPKVYQINRMYVETYLDYKMKGMRITERVHQVMKKSFHFYCAESS